MSNPNAKADGDHTNDDAFADFELPDVPAHQSIIPPAPRVDVTAKPADAVEAARQRLERLASAGLTDVTDEPDEPLAEAE